MVKNKSGCDYWSVVTTVMKPTPAVGRQAKLGPNWCLVIVLDEKSPVGYKIAGLTATEVARVTYLDIEAQKEFAHASSIAMVELIPLNSFGRKNVGYLYAISQGAKRIWDFDDDNMLLEETFTVPGLQEQVLSYDKLESQNVSTFNSYPMMGASNLPIWPRGLPLSSIQSKPTFLFATNMISRAAVPESAIAIIQSLANNDPDVDAIYRLTQPLPVNFQRENVCVEVPDNSYTPLNAQATLFFEPALWMLFLPTSIHGRVSDIWRGYIAQRLAMQIDKKVYISSPLVTQYRNHHNYLADFQSEQDLYLKSEILIAVLENITLKSDSIPGCLEEIYIELYNRDFIGKEDIQLVQQWILAVKTLGYNFPKIHSLNNHASTQSATGSIKKQKSPPQCFNITRLQLFVPLTASHHKEFQEQLLRSLLFFYPLKSINLLAILDEEENTTQLVQHLKQETKDFQNFVIKYNKHTPFYCDTEDSCKKKNGSNKFVYGRNRQQLIMFWADNFTQYELVGFVDTDTFFITPVIQEDLFEKGKPVINALHAITRHRWWEQIKNTTENALGKVEQFRCMSYFPVIIKTKHLKDLRATIQKRHGLSFNEYFRSIKTELYSQFNIMCNYLWYHHRNEYAWHIQLTNEGSVNASQLAKNEEKFSASDMYPKPRISIHTTYHYVHPTKALFNRLMAMGYCYDAEARQLREMLEWCRNNSVTLPDVNPHMFNFESISLQRHPKVKEFFQLRQKIFKQCQPHDWNKTELRRISSDLSTERSQEIP